MSTYHDYRYRFPAVGLALAADAFTALRAAGLLPPNGLPENMLGDPLLLNGAEVARGRQGRAAVDTTDPIAGEAMHIPAVGDPTMIYVHIRSETPPEALPAGFTPATFGLIATTATESAVVLGVWA